MRITFPQSRKAWSALIFATLTTAAVAWQQYANLIPNVTPEMITAVGGLLAAVAVFFVPNQPIAQSSTLLDPRGPNKFEPTTKAEPAPTEQPGRHRGESREHH